VAGSPQRQLVREELAKLAIEQGAEEPEVAEELEQPREEYRRKLPLLAVADWLSEGRTLQQLGTLLTARCGFNVSRKTVARAVDRIPGAEDVLREAREDAADSMVEEGLTILDDVPEQREAIQKAQARVEQRKWMAARLAPRKYGDSKSVSLNVAGLGALALEALRKQRLDAAAPVAQLAAPAVEAEILEDAADAAVND
jgi:hypothetical protein